VEIDGNNHNVELPTDFNQIGELHGESLEHRNEGREIAKGQRNPGEGMGAS
jgi:hypothetical protein